MSITSKLIILAFLIFIVITLASVMRHALMILPFVATGFYIYWKSGENDEGESGSL
jgi:hypothetical protein